MTVFKTSESVLETFSLFYLTLPKHVREVLKHIALSFNLLTINKSRKILPVVFLQKIKLYIAFKLFSNCQAFFISAKKKKEKNH